MRERIMIERANRINWIERNKREREGGCERVRERERGDERERVRERE